MTKEILALGPAIDGGGIISGPLRTFTERERQRYWRWPNALAAQTSFVLLEASLNHQPFLALQAANRLEISSPLPPNLAFNRSELLHLGTRPVDCLAFLTNKNNISPDQIKVYLTPVTIGEKQRYALLVRTNSNEQRDYTFLYLTAHLGELLSFPQQTGLKPEVIDAKTLLELLD